MTNHSTLKKPPRWMLMQAILRTPKLSRYQIRLAGILLDHANSGTGACFPGDAVLLKEVGFSDARELRRCLRQLEKDGWLRIQMDKAGRRKIIFNWERAYVRPGKEAVEDTDTPDAADLDEAAEAVWERTKEIFPQNKYGQHWDKAKPIFAEIVRGGLDLNEFLLQVERYAESRKGEDIKYTSSIRNWLEKGLWKGNYAVTAHEQLEEVYRDMRESKIREVEGQLCPCGAPLKSPESHYCGDCLESMMEGLEQDCPRSQWE